MRINHLIIIINQKVVATDIIIQPNLVLKGTEFPFPFGIGKIINLGAKVYLQRVFLRQLKQFGLICLKFFGSGGETVTINPRCFFFLHSQPAGTFFHIFMDNQMIGKADFFPTETNGPVKHLTERIASV